ncbi:hypothetical protein R1flu_015426 [Riccia fluitans]|uniref:SHSP domain-containing protein n=1 Tax=Riccia fluitans TaxID=41844 RepID=A0ABD1YJ90_9MARC
MNNFNRIVTIYQPTTRLLEASSSGSSAIVLWNEKSAAAASRGRIIVPSRGEISAVSPVWNSVPVETVLHETISPSPVGNVHIILLETTAAHIIKADVPGMRTQDLQVKVEAGPVLQIRGERIETWPLDIEENFSRHRGERWIGGFVRCFKLPETVVIDRISAELDIGVLTVTIPKLRRFPAVHWFIPIRTAVNANGEPEAAPSLEAEPESAALGQVEEDEASEERKMDENTEEAVRTVLEDMIQALEGDQDIKNPARSSKQSRSNSRSPNSSQSFSQSRSSVRASRRPSAATESRSSLDSPETPSSTQVLLESLADALQKRISESFSSVSVSDSDAGVRTGESSRKASQVNERKSLHETNSPNSTSPENDLHVDVVDHDLQGRRARSRTTFVTDQIPNERKNSQNLLENSPPSGSNQEAQSRKGSRQQPAETETTVERRSLKILPGQDPEENETSDKEIRRSSRRPNDSNPSSDQETESEIPRSRKGSRQTDETSLQRKSSREVLGRAPEMSASSDKETQGSSVRQTGNKPESSGGQQNAASSRRLRRAYTEITPDVPKAALPIITSGSNQTPNEELPLDEEVESSSGAQSRSSRTSSLSSPESFR